MKALIALIVLIATGPAAGSTTGRFELTSAFVPLPEATAGRFALRGRLQPAVEPEPSGAAGRFGVTPTRKGPGSPCDDLLFRDGYE